MNNRWRLSTALALVITTTTICSGQSPTQLSGIDPALLAKANAANPDAQFRVGTQYELGAHVARDPAQAAALQAFLTSALPALKSGELNPTGLLVNTTA